MAETDASFGGLVVPPKVPVFTDDTVVEEYLKEIEKHLKKVSGVIGEVGLAIETSFQVDQSRIINLTVTNLWADNIITDDLVIGSNDNIRLNGVTLFNIEVWDNQATPVRRAMMGKFGAGNTQWGFQAWDASGSLKFQVGDTTFIDGAIISNATILSAAIFDLDGNKLQAKSVDTGQLADGAVGNLQVSDLNAVKLTAGIVAADRLTATNIQTGTLTVSNASVALEVTSAGKMLFSSGGDIVMKATGAGDFNYIVWQNSGGTQKGRLYYDQTNDIMKIGAAINNNEPALYLHNSGATLSRVLQLTAQLAHIRVGVSVAEEIELLARCDSDFDPDTHNTYDLGGSSLKWKTIYAVTTSFGDIGLGNDWYWTETNRFFENVPYDDGIMLIDNEENIIEIKTKTKNYAHDNLQDYPFINNKRLKTPTVKVREDKPEEYYKVGKKWIRRLLDNEDGTFLDTTTNRILDPKVDWEELEAIRKGGPLNAKEKEEFRVKYVDKPRIQAEDRTAREAK